MEKINACIVSLFMDNIHQKTVEMHREVVQKMNPQNYPSYQFKANMRHGVFLDYFWGLNGVKAGVLKQENIQQNFNYDVVIILDIDCVPLQPNAFELYAAEAYNGNLIGNAQRTNHLNNGKHVFAAPSASAISKQTYVKIHAPSALETDRSDVLEEYTWAAESFGVPVKKIMPLRYDRAPLRYDWEKDQPPYWELGDNMPVYGMGTTYGDQEHGELFWHNFQIRLPGQEQMFWKKCEEILTRDIYEDCSIKY